MPKMTVHLSEDLLAVVDQMSEDQDMDHSTIFRRARKRGLEALSLDQAVDRYQRGGVSVWQAADSSGVPLVQLLEELATRGLGLRNDEELLASQLDDLK